MDITMSVAGCDDQGGNDGVVRVMMMMVMVK